MKISRQAVGDRTLGPYQVTYAAPAGLSHDRHIEGLPLGTRGGMLIRHTFPLDAEHEFTVTGGGPGGGTPGGALIDVTLDGENRRRKPAQVHRSSSRRTPRHWHCAGRSPAIGRCRRSVFDFRTNAVLTNPGGVQNLLITGPFKPTGTGDTLPAPNFHLSAGDTERRTSLRDQDPVDARAPGISRTGHRR